MLRGRLLGLAGLALLASPMAAETPDPFEAKVRALAHPRYAEREKAARELLAAGEPALKALKTALASSDEELRARAAAVTEKIEHAARSKRLLNAPTLALKFEKTPLDQAVNEVVRKTGLRLTVERSKVADVKRPVTVDTGTVPFWEAVETFYKAAGLIEEDNPASNHRSDAIVSTGGRRLSVRSFSTARPGADLTRLIDGMAPPSATGQVFRVRALPANYGSNKYDDLKGEITFYLDVDSVPTVDVQEIIGVEVRRAVAEDRRALAPTYPPREGNPFFSDGPWGGQVVIINGDLVVDGMSGQAGPYFPVTLKEGGKRPRQLAELHGAVEARIIAPPEPVLTVTDVFGKGKGQTFRAEGVTCQVTAANPNGELLQTPTRVPALPRPVGTVQSPEPPVATHVQGAAFSVRLVATDGVGDVLNLPVQVKGKLRPFIRLNRRSTWGGPVEAPDFQVRDGDGKPLRILATRFTEETFDGITTVQEVQLTIEKPAKGLDGTSFTVATRRPVVVEMPFVLKDVPLP